MNKHRTVIGVIGSGAQGHEELSVPLGRWLGESGYDLVNGGGGGVMAATARGFSEIEDRLGQVIGIIPSAGPCDSPVSRKAYQTPPGYPNDYTDIVIRTHLHLSGSQGTSACSRNSIVVLTADAIIALPGSEGTRSEIELALEFEKPLALYCPDGEWDDYSDKAVRVSSIADIQRWLGEALPTKP